LLHRLSNRVIVTKLSDNTRPKRTNGMTS
jgi:hypothetical protein